MKIYSMKTNHLTNPVGYPFSPLRLSYKVKDSRGKHQKSACIRVYQNEEVIYDSGVRSDIDSLCFVPEIALRERTAYSWDVEVTADNGESARSPRAYFETGKMGETWDGQWITPVEKIENPCVFKHFALPEKIQSARLYICGLGMYEAYINGQKVGNEYFTPYCNDYDHWLQYQTFDVTNLLSEENTLSIMLGDGWYKGRFGYWKKREIYGDTLALLCELRVQTAAGEVVIPSDNTWRCRETPVRFSNIYDGEILDLSANCEEEHAVRLYPEMGYERVTERLSLPVRIKHEIKPKEIIHTPKNEVIIDFGQEVTGFVTFRARGEKGHQYHLKYCEILQNGCFYNDNLRSAKAEYTCITDGREQWIRPHFTFYGFRYVLLEGFGEAPDPEDFTACVLYSDMEQTGFIKTNNAKVNRLCENVLWGQRGNFLDVPTDCPQRDERLGWTGDAQIFCATACYQMDSAAFYTKYMHDIATEQRANNGAVPHFVPNFRRKCNPSCAWADVAAVIPWQVYQFYGDKSLLENQYANMKMWVEWIFRVDEETGSKRLWHAGFHFADWLSLDAEFATARRGGTDRDFIASCYYLYSARLTAKAAGVLGLAADAARYRLLEDEILHAIRKEYFTLGGKLALNTQTAYVLALLLGLPEEKWIPRMRRALDQKFEESDNELRTGFVGTGYLCRVLSANGFSPLVYTLFLREDYPGWLYEVNMGATTVWERWNSVLPDGRISDTGMNSLNHYAYGVVMEWLYGDAAGISPVENAPGFRRVRMQPHPDSRLPEVDFAYESAVGRYRSAFKVTGEKSMIWQVSVPFGGAAELILPKGNIIGNAQFVETTDGMFAMVTAGDYEFTCEFDVSPWKKSILDYTFSELKADETLWKEILDAAPDIENVFAIKNPDVTTFRMLRDYHWVNFSSVQFRRVDELLCNKCFN